LGRGWRGDSGDRPVGDFCIVALDLGEKFQGGFGACGVALGLQTHAHDPVKGEGEEADERVRPDAVRQAVVDRRDLDVGFEDAEPALDIGKTLVARDSLCRADVGGIGNQGERAVEELGLGYSEPPRIYRRVICSYFRRPYRVSSGLHRRPLSW
jgi:hypothetical protein